MGEFARTGEREREHVLGHFVDAVVAHVADHDATHRGSLDIDVVEPHAVADDAPTCRHLTKAHCVDSNCASEEYSFNTIPHMRVAR